MAYPLLTPIPPTLLMVQSHCYQLSRFWNNKRLLDNLRCLRKNSCCEYLVFIFRCGFSIHALFRHVFTGECLCVSSACLFNHIDTLCHDILRHLLNNQQSMKSCVNSCLKQFVSDNTLSMTLQQPPIACWLNSCGDWKHNGHGDGSDCHFIKD